MTKFGIKVIAGISVIAGVVIALEPLLAYRLLGDPGVPSRNPYLVLFGLWLIGLGLLMVLARDSARMHALSLIVGYAPLAVFAALGALTHPTSSWLFAINSLIVVYCATCVIEGLWAFITGSDVRTLREDD